jgi:5-formyltetrahydrofolate cyclo-ligase
MNAQSASAAKAALRARVLSARDQLPAMLRASAGAALIDRVQRLPEWLAAGTLLLYLGIKTEFDPEPLALAVLAAGHRLVLPRILRGQGGLEIRAVRDPDADLVSGVWGLREPDPARCPEVAPAAIDFILVPGVAFDARGGRIGYGAGYYDRLLSDPALRAVRVAALFDVQLVESVPCESHDRPVDVLVLPGRQIRVRNAASDAHVS